MQCEGILSIIVYIVGNGIGNPSSILDEAVCVLLQTISLGKGINPSVLSPAKGK